jgi:hypothetical protein
VAYRGIFLEELSQTTKNHSQNDRYPGHWRSHMPAEKRKLDILVLFWRNSCFKILRNIFLMCISWLGDAYLCILKWIRAKSRYKSGNVSSSPCVCVCGNRLSSLGTWNSWAATSWSKKREFKRLFGDRRTRKAEAGSREPLRQITIKVTIKSNQIRCTGFTGLVMIPVLRWGFSLCFLWSSG